jgi:hypothetical protein
MTGRADFSAEEWDAILEGPTCAGMIVSAAQRGGSFREAFAMAKSFAEARQEHGESALLDEIVAEKPETDRMGARSPEELREKGLNRIREAVALVERQASPEELAEYRRFVLSLAHRVAAAKDEGGGDPSSEAENAAIAAIETALGS